MSILNKCFIKEEKIFPLSLGGKEEITVRQLTAGEGIEFQNMIRDKDFDQQDAMYYAVRCAMVEPKFFTDEELEKLNSMGLNLIQEIYSQIATIGMSAKEKKEHEKKIQEMLKKMNEDKEEKAEDTEEDIEKK